MASANVQFAQAANDWDLETLYTDLASAKGKRLTPVEKLHLRGLLCGYSPAEIAEKLNKSVKGVGVDLCQTLYQYVRNLVDRGEEKIENWRNIAEWLEEAGYKTQLSTEYQLSNGLPLDVSLQKANISFDKDKNNIIVDINLRIVAASPSEQIIVEDSNRNGNN
ncbi:MAG: hypothetical protein WBG73_06940 [Coleofasciculaceae cyanobacterium]